MIGTNVLNFKTEGRENEMEMELLDYVFVKDEHKTKSNTPVIVIDDKNEYDNLI